MKYRIIILIIIIISLGKISLSYIANTSRTHACTCTHSRCAQSVRHGWAHRFRRWRDNGRSVIHWNKQHAGDSVLTIGLGFFAYKTNSRPNWDANSWQDMLSNDTISLRHLTRRSSKNCDLPFENNDRFKANYRIDWNSFPQTVVQSVSLNLYYNSPLKVCLSVLANCRSQFLLDRLGRCLKLFVSTDSTSCHEFASQFNLAIFVYAKKSNQNLGEIESPARVFIYMTQLPAMNASGTSEKGR